MTNRVEFTLTGHITPYVRMTQGGKFSDPAAQRYLASQEALRVQMKAQMAAAGAEMLPAKTKLGVDGWVGTDRKGDLDNIIKAILDAAQGIVFPDDRWVDFIIVHRVLIEPRDKGPMAHILFREYDPREIYATLLAWREQGVLVEARI